ncbi:MAG: hypothetical protein AUH71_00280 [Thaumarchaeota archaeon 13_1_40CM_4_48_7]|nr:MAG: hypothetical protein AUH71_00280 [Thaumarchaeota archaeon 13_1_40CM_4_48_7]
MSDSNIGKTYYLAEATWGNGVFVKPWDYNIVIPETPCNSSKPGIQMSTEAFLFSLNPMKKIPRHDRYNKVSRDILLIGIL